ncbi:hypothetical protein SAMN04488515_0232 [Cognatiyoonia koreensis]|uniref:Gamma-glutamylcyclotransferase AIG2-like domain-containing protein n=1 Tax=Cognatiyoonia koreensis TaxID=364200 RepID=A0A1I0MU15_9RHOB|nr:gamma-glutamylcyclotransferase family protein [Cognatiyoonia koreensis]SEV91987.1 hypothetical protein SAMN04488515_0232 [Cognatiyoonia koreensis]
MTPSFFGYGSLVNLATHNYPNVRKATLTGWRRVWCHANTRPVAFLSVHRAMGAIDGIIADVPDADWTALDLREHAYLRQDVSDVLGGTTAIYQANPAKISPPSAGHPILLSYLDVVVQGFRTQYGEDGVAAFFESTDGWGPIRNDRSDPYYPRFQNVAAVDRALVDHHLAQLSAQVK